MHVIEGMTDTVYHSDPIAQFFPSARASLSSGCAHTLLTQSPAHAWHEHPRLNPNHKPDDDVKFSVGTAAHSLFLQGSTDGIIIVDADDWRTKAAQAQRDGALAAGQTPILRKHWDDVQAMALAAQRYVASNPELAGVMNNGKAEQSVFWEEDGAFFRIRPDWVPNDLSMMLDYKTTAGSAHPEAWSRSQIGNMGYDIQCALYRRGAQAALGKVMPFVFLVQESYAPYACSSVVMCPEDIARAEDRVETAIRIWRECLRKDEWPAYPARICTTVAPAWAEANWAEGKAYLMDTMFGGNYGV